MERQRMQDSALLELSNSPRFHVRCKAGQEGLFSMPSDSLSVTVAQRIRREGNEEMWDSRGCLR